MTLEKRLLCLVLLSVTISCDATPISESAAAMPPEAAGVRLGMSRHQLLTDRDIYSNSGDLTERIDSVGIAYWFGGQIRDYAGDGSLAAVVVSYPASQVGKAEELAAKWQDLAGPPDVSAVKVVTSITGAAVPTRIMVWHYGRVQMAQYQPLEDDPGTYPPMRELNAIVARSNVPLSALFDGFD